jgi:predicted cobalt transporter CbtA
LIRSLLVRGMLVGILAGVLAFAFAYVFGEPQVQHAIDFEDQLARVHHDAAEAEVVSRGTQRTLGLLTGTLVTGIALGGIFSLVFAWAYGRVGALSARATAALLAAGAYVTVVLAPFTKYPANPPSIGNPETIGRRTLLYLTMIAISLLAAVAAARIRRALRPRLDAWNASIVALAAFLVLLAIAQLILPAIHETPARFPADVLYRFRLASLGTQLTLWTTIGLAFGAAAQRVVAAARTRSAAA